MLLIIISNIILDKSQPQKSTLAANLGPVLALFCLIFIEVVEVHHT